MAEDPFIKGILERDIKKLDPNEIKRSIQKANKDIERQLHPNRFKPKARIGTCVFCGGKVTEDFVQKFDASSGPMIIGPGSRDQFYWASTGLGCIDCGLAYKKLPKQQPGKHVP